MFSIAAKTFRAAFLATLFVIPTSAFAAALITPEEAALPPQKGAVATSNRGITRGPKITVSEDGAKPAPIRFQVKFQPLGGSTIDSDGLKVIYLKQPNVDLTPRVNRSCSRPASICRTRCCRPAIIWCGSM